MYRLKTTGSLHPILQQRQAEREGLLRHIRQAVEQDERIVAAWLFGSLGRGKADALSDMDIFIVAADEHIKAIIAERYAFMAQFGELALVQEAPQNAPPQGVYNMALYAGTQGPQQVDWYWQMQSAARIPEHTIVLLDRVGLPRSDGPPQFAYQPVPERTRLEAITQDVIFFWVMLLITAKYVARSPQEETMGMLNYVLAPLRQVQTFVGVPACSVPDDAPVPSPAEKLRLLRELAADMETLMPAVAEAGGSVSALIVPQAALYLALIEATAQDAVAVKSVD